MYLTAHSHPAPEQTVAPVVNIVQGQQSASLFEQVFGEVKQSNRVILPLWINDRLQQNVLVNILPNKSNSIEILAKDLLALSDALLRPDIQKILSSNINQNGFLSAEALRQHGIEVIFDNRRAELRIQIPPVQRKSKISSLAKQAIQKELNEAIKPSQISGYLNLRGSQSIDWLGSKTKVAGRQPLQLGVEGVINLGGWVLESDAQFTEGEPLQRGNIRIIHDNLRQALRYVVGDFSPPTTGYQAGSSMLGIAVARNYSLQPDRVTRPINQFQFFLERKSRVEVFSNGRSLQSLTLDPGTQDIRDLPLDAGINDVQLVITDDLGQVKRLDFAATTASNLLAPGLQQFSYSVGVPSQKKAGNFVYNWQQPSLNLAYRWGVNSSFTTGAYFQANPKAQLLGWENYLATSIGMWNWDTAISHHQEIGTDIAAKVRYDYTKVGKTNPTQQLFGFTAEYRGQNFMSLGDLEPNNKAWLELNTYYNQKIFGSIDSTINLRYQFNRIGSNFYQLSAGISKKFDRGFTLGAKVSHKQQSDRPDTQFLMNFNWTRTTSGQSFQTASNFSNQEAANHRFSWDTHSANAVEGIKTNVGLDLINQNTNLSSRLAYTGNHLNLELSHNGNLRRDTKSNPRQETQLKFASAIAFANGQWAISRPVSNSFAIITLNQEIQRQSLGVNPDGKGGYAAQSKGGSAVIPDLSPYQLTMLRLDVPDLPVGVDLGESTLKLLPTYKSGTLVRVGKAATIFLRGVLQDAAGTPLEFNTGQIISLSDSNWQPIQLFTNKVGRFALTGFKPGKYEIQLFHPQIRRVIFEIPEETKGVYTIELLKATVSESPEKL